jgi:fumarate reductase subunit C
MKYIIDCWQKQVKCVGTLCVSQRLPLNKITLGLPVVVVAFQSSKILYSCFMECIMNCMMMIINVFMLSLCNTL